MTLEDFKQTRRPISDEMFAYLPDALDTVPPRATLFEYAEGYLLEERDGAFYSHAWFYDPRPFPTLAEAEADLFDWRNEIEA